MAHSHSHDNIHDSHSHLPAGGAAAENGHSHEILDGPGSFLGREMPLISGRDWRERAFTVGIGGYNAPNCLHPSTSSTALYTLLHRGIGSRKILESQLWMKSAEADTNSKYTR